MHAAVKKHSNWTENEHYKTLKCLSLESTDFSTLSTRVQACGLLRSMQGRKAAVDESHPAAAVTGWGGNA